jgi:surfactin synthase thioesterase subunit
MHITLFCFPFAGGSKYSLHFLKKVLPPNISCHFLEYPGRGTRIKEDFSQDIHEVVDDLYVAMAPLLHKPYALYGHSMGAKVAYLIAQKIRKEGQRAPLHVFISGTDAPSVPSKNGPRHLLPKEEFVAAVKDLGGLPDEILKNDELLEYFEPILRADFRASETYTHVHATPLPTPFTVMVGDKEDMEDEDILEWQSETSVPLKLYKFPGNHFFIYQNEKEIGKVIEASLVL